MVMGIKVRKSNFCDKRNTIWQYLIWNPNRIFIFLGKITDWKLIFIFLRKITDMEIEYIETSSSEKIGPDHVQVFWKNSKCFGNISQLETRPLIGWPSTSTNQRPGGFQLTYVSKTLMLPKHLHMIRPVI